MAIDGDFVDAFIQAMRSSGWETTLPNQDLPNPLDISFVREGVSLNLLIHARRITPQRSDSSSHHRPSGEMHVQMIFDGDQRGRGVRNALRFAEHTRTLLLGFYLFEGDNYVIAAFDPEYHREYAYSKSLQVKESALERARKSGIAFQSRKSDEIVVIFRIEEIDEYLALADEFHSLSPIAFADEGDTSLPDHVQQVVSESIPPDTLPQLEAEERRSVIRETLNYVRNRAFALGIKAVYERCAICGFQYDYVLDAAHIVPVAEGGTDTYDNGLGLCPTCHRMFDRGFILVDAERRIHINTRYAEEYDQINRADGLTRLRDTLRESLWLPADERYQPSSENLRRTFESRR